MKKSLLFGSLAVAGLLCGGRSARAQGAIVSGGTYKMTHYGVVADGSAATYGVPAGTPLCFDVNLGLATAGATIGQWGDNGSDGQRYIFEGQADGSYKLRHKGTAMYVQPIGLSKTALTHIEQNVLLTTGDDAQCWFITDPNNNGRYKFTMKNSANAMGVSQCLEIGYASAAPGAFADIFDDNNFEPAQRWQLTLAAAPLAARNGATSGALSAAAYPNPAGRGQGLTVLVETARAGAAQVEVLDMLGHRVQTQSAVLKVGGNQVGLANDNLAAGVYVVRVRQGDFIEQTRLVRQ